MIGVDTWIHISGHTAFGGVFFSGYKSMADSIFCFPRSFFRIALGS